MSIHAALHHKTHYKYTRPISVSPQIIRLRPAPHSKTRLVSYAMKVEPANHFINWQQDPHGNFLARLVFPEKIREFKVEVDLVAEMSVINPFDFFVDDYGTNFPFEYREPTRSELAPYLIAAVDTGPEFDKLIKEIDLTPRNTVDFLVELNQIIEQKIDYLIRMEPGVQTPEETLSSGSGSCRDSSWLLVNILRSLGLAARFASGYLIQLKPDVKALDGPSGTDKDFCDLHAWAEVFLPGAGWIGFDPTSGLLAGESHIPLACSPMPGSAAPITGSIEDVETEFLFDMEVQRIYESPRVTKPYTEQQWERINQLGNHVDQAIALTGEELTMGGEPTFVSIDDFEGEEWTVSAVGPEKLKLSGLLIKRLRKQFAPGGILHFGTGKWYPGESLPRWAYTCLWRKDGQPLWSNLDLLAEIEKDYGYGHAEAQKFLETLSETLGVEPQHIMPAYEDVWYYLWREQKLPDNVDPLESKLKDREERARLASIFTRGLDEPKGFVLPLQRYPQAKASKWMSGSWFLRQKNLFLIPGDSPIGLRLPIESQPWVSQSNYNYIIPPDPSLIDAALPNVETIRSYYQQQAATLLNETGNRQRPGEFGPRSQSLDDTPDASEGKRDPIVRTALCVQPRDGKLFIFMPPVRESEEYLELITAIERTAEKLNMPVMLEGELPPADPRLETLKVTPDPGVIEVNVQPAKNWDELVNTTTTVYEEARQTRLGTEKFLIDGKHVGTGGGNHFVLGASHPQKSPFLRRPDLLSSMLAYWLHHPSLSYFFGGLFVGPTSQAPRIDEARMDSLYELEVAMQELQQHQHIQPWLVDRLFRNLLTDITGNTHRAEFCIDKLYSPDRASGRLGLLELRSFEMPPHPRMSLAQQLLLRALIAWFLKEPYKPHRLIRWNTQLHDRWMLPHYQWQDLCEVLDDLRRAGFAFENEWFAAHFDFRFPRYGSVHYRDIELELRGAIEPWHVLGEEGMAGGTVRFVDSSLERLQVRLLNHQPERYALLCNGRRVPLTQTRQSNEHIAGVRFRAWQPPECLHPTIPVHAPLIFDLVDTWSQHSIGGCTYHVAHPAGRNYETMPVNPFEAESRRLSRFEEIGHTPGRIEEIPEAQISEEYPLTLDLRRVK